MFLFFDFISRAFNPDVQVTQSREAQRMAKRIEARRQRRKAAEVVCRAH